MTKPKNKFKTACVLPDIHFPYEDKLALKIAIDIIKHIKPDCIIQVGDLIDCYPISKYAKDPDRSSGIVLQQEFNVAKDFIRTMTNIAPTYILEGNHCVRLKKYLKEKAPGLSGLDVLNIKDLLGIDGKQSFYTQYKYLGKLFVTHGDIWSKSGCAESAGTAKANVLKSGLNVMCGHIHRLGEYHKTMRSGDLVGYEIGCLCSTKVEYVTDPNWQHGMAVVQYTDKGNKDFNVQLIHIAKRSGKYRAFYGKTLFTN